MGFAPRLAGLARLSIRSPSIVRSTVSCCPSAAIGLAPAVTPSWPRRLHVFGTGGAESAGAGSGHWYSSRTARLIGFVGVSVVTPLFGTAACEKDKSAAAAAAAAATVDAPVAEATLPKPRSPNPYIEKITANPKMQEAIDDVAFFIGSKISSLIETGVPSQITAGFTAGFCMGFAIKKSLKVAAIVIGFLFTLVQLLAYTGYVDTDWSMLSKDFTAVLDANGDGVIDDEDMKIWFQKLSAVIGYNLPAGSGVLAGLLLGLKTG